MNFVRRALSSRGFSKLPDAPLFINEKFATGDARKRVKEPKITSPNIEFLLDKIHDPEIPLS